MRSTGGGSCCSGGGAQRACSELVRGPGVVEACLLPERKTALASNSQRFREICRAQNVDAGCGTRSLSPLYLRLPKEARRGGVTRGAFRVRSGPEYGGSARRVTGFGS